jgi:hypothetical protein
MERLNTELNDTDLGWTRRTLESELYGAGPLSRALYRSVVQGDLSPMEAIAVARACHGVSKLGWRPESDLYLGDVYAADLAYLVTTDADQRGIAG